LRRQTAIAARHKRCHRKWSFCRFDAQRCSGSQSPCRNPQVRHKRGAVRDLGSRSTGIGCIPALVAFLTILTAVRPGQITVNPASVSFGSVPVGSSQTQSASLTNSGGSDVTVSQATVNATGFTLNGLPLPLTLSAGQSAIFSVTFTPRRAAPTAAPFPWSPQFPFMLRDTRTRPRSPAPLWSPYLSRVRVYRQVSSQSHPPA